MNAPELEVMASAPTACGDLLDMVGGNDGKKARGFFLQSIVSRWTSGNLHFYLLHWCEKKSLVWILYI